MSDTLLFIDFEASSLDPASYPIEFGWASLTGSGSFLIRPEQAWADWNAAAELVHGIPRDTLMAEGLPAAQAAARILELAPGRFLVSDAPSFDFGWLGQLLKLTGIPADHWPGIADNTQIEWIETARLLDVPPPEGVSVQMERLRCLHAGTLARKDFAGVRHRAETDARRMLCAYQAVRAAVAEMLEAWEQAAKL
jgi:hypothetical protein